jgi:cellulose synthase/poly-beta-1,6-N-acetylglucosamine synthase-like glycosyltransferase
VGLLLHGGVLLLWLTLLYQAFYSQGLSFWSTGIAYTVYDTLLLLFVGWHTLVLRQPLPPPAPGPRPRMGVVVAAYNEAGVLPLTLHAILSQIDAPEQIVIADDGSSDGTAALLSQRFGLTTPAEGGLSAPSSIYATLRWLRLPHAGKAMALNAALLQLDTEVVLTIDADTLLAADATLAMRRAFAARPGLVAAGGILTPVCGKKLRNRFFQWFQNYEYMRNFISRFAWMQLHSLLLISGAFSGFRREALLAVGGFDPECLVEDYELVHRLQRHAIDGKLDWEVQIVGSAHAQTDAPGRLGDFLRQRRRWFAGFLQTQYWNRDMTGNRRYGTLGTLMLPVKAIDTLQPVYGLTAFFLLLYLIVAGRLSVLLPVLGIIAAKTLIDLLFHLWTIRLYRRWTGLRSTSNAASAMLAALAEPFSFQLLRHLGAVLGWFYFLTGRQHWGRQKRGALGGK